MWGIFLNFLHCIFFTNILLLRHLRTISISWVPTLKLLFFITFYLWDFLFVLFFKFNMKLPWKYVFNLFYFYNRILHKYLEIPYLSIKFCNLLSLLYLDVIALHKIEVLKDHLAIMCSQQWYAIVSLLKIGI